MTDEQAPPGEATAGPAAGRRLDSWKRIAAYLQRDVRTVKRWEKTEGLPVHRHLHRRQASVYAYEEELDAWRVNRRPAREAEARAARKRRIVWLASVAITAAAVVAAIGSGLWLRSSPALPFSERDWVLICRFDNRTGEPVFNGAIEYALERELADSRFVNVVPRERIRDALRLMRKPPDTAVNAKVGREIALRDGGIQVLISGRVAKLDGTYLLSVNLVNPRTGATVVSLSEEAAGRHTVVASVRRLADRVRKALGEKLAGIGHDEPRLAKVTTPSLRALQLFTQADAMIGADNNAAAEALLRQAIVEDPEFASAYMHLAFSIVNQGRPREEALPYAKKAVELSGNATVRERFFILASFYSIAGQQQKAAGAYEALLRLYPDHFWANSNMSIVSFLLGRYEEGARYRARAARLRPNSFTFNMLAAGDLSRWPTKPFEAQPFVRRALALGTYESALEKARESQASGEDHIWARSVIWLELYPAREYWLEGDLDRARRAAAAKTRQLKSRHGRERDLLAWNLRQVYLMLGQLTTVETLSPDAVDRLAVAFARGDDRALRAEVRRSLAHGGQDVGPPRMMLAARLGMLPEAEQAYAIAEKGDLSVPWASWSNPEVAEGIRNIMRGELARARGHTAEALPLLEKGFDQLPPLGLDTYFLAAASLADVYEQQGDSDKAIQVLTRAGEERRRAAYDSGFATLLWMQDQVQLARLYRKLGRLDDARQIETQLRELLVYADKDHVILKQLAELDAAATS